MDQVSIDGWCDPRFAAVREQFALNFAERGETGGAVCVTAHGTVVADLTGGWADLERRRPWAADTLEEPWWQPGHGHGYHVSTFGFLGGELIRRITGLMPGEYLRCELAGPLRADVWIGLPAAEHRRVAEFSWPQQAAAAAGDGGEAAAGSGNLARPPESDDNRDPAGLVSSGVMTWNAYLNPPDLSGAGVLNSAAWRSAQLPSANAHATAAGVARLPADASGASVRRRGAVDSGALAAAVQERVYGSDLVLLRPTRFGLGFQLTHPERRFGGGVRSFGHFGAGGSVGFCDPDAGLAVGYVTSQMGPRWRNPRNSALMDACYASL